MIRLRDLVTGQQADVYDASTSRGLARWDVLIARLFPVSGVWKLGPAALVFGAIWRQEFIDLLTTRWNHFQQKERPSWRDFMKTHGWLLLREHTRSLKQRPLPRRKSPG